MSISGAMTTMLSEFSSKLTCLYCGKPNSASRWRSSGDLVPFYNQREHGEHSVSITCPHCDKTWYVVWDEYPGAVVQLRPAPPSSDRATTKELEEQTDKGTGHPTVASSGDHSTQRHINEPPVRQTHTDTRESIGRVKCSKCGQVYKVKIKLAGKTFKCKKCQAAIKVSVQLSTQVLQRESAKVRDDHQPIRRGELGMGIGASNLKSESGKPAQRESDSTIFHVLFFGPGSPSLSSKQLQLHDLLMVACLGVSVGCAIPAATRLYAAMKTNFDPKGFGTVDQLVAPCFELVVLLVIGILVGERMARPGFTRSVFGRDPLPRNLKKPSRQRRALPAPNDVPIKKARDAAESLATKYSNRTIGELIILGFFPPLLTCLVVLTIGWAAPYSIRTAGRVISIVIAVAVLVRTREKRLHCSCEYCPATYNIGQDAFLVTSDSEKGAKESTPDFIDAIPNGIRLWITAFDPPEQVLLDGRNGVERFWQCGKCGAVQPHAWFRAEYERQIRAEEQRKADIERRKLEDERIRHERRAACEQKRAEVERTRTCHCETCGRRKGKLDDGPYHKTCRAKCERAFRERQLAIKMAHSAIIAVASGPTDFLAKMQSTYAIDAVARDARKYCLWCGADIPFVECNCPECGGELPHPGRAAAEGDTSRD